MNRHHIFRWFRRDHVPRQQQGSGNGLIFSANNETLMENRETLLEERISLLDGRTNPIRYFSVHDLNSIMINSDPILQDGLYKSYGGVWDGKSVLVKTFCNCDSSVRACRDIAVATQVANHRNIHQLLGCCLATTYPVLVYEWPENGTLDERIRSYQEQGKQPLEWKARLRIAREIAEVVAYLHTAFPGPIVHRDLKPKNVFLDQDDSARLSDFSLSISIPEGENYVEDSVIGTLGYLAPDYMMSGNVAASSDVFAFGVLLLVILTGKSAHFTSESYEERVRLVDWVSECRTSNCLGDIVDQAITINGPVTDENFEHQLKELVDIALKCSSENEVLRPTMLDVATQLNNIIVLSSESL